MEVRRKIIPIKQLETAKPGYANGISTQLQALIEKGEHRSLNDKEKQKIIKSAAKHYGKFLTSLGVDWVNDPNSAETPMRVAKSFVKEIWEGRYNVLPDISSFPSDSYSGCITQTNVDVKGICSHHHREICGVAHVSYCPSPEGKVIGLSKINRIISHFSRRGCIQEQLTEGIWSALDKICEGNLGCAIQIVSHHSCVKCRGVNQNSVMVTTRLSGVYKQNDNLARLEFFEAIKSASLLGKA